MKRYIALYFSFFIFHFCISQNGWIWGQYGKGLGIESSIVLDNVENCIMTGEFAPDSIVFSNSVLHSKPGNRYNTFIVKYDKNGNLLWTQQSYGNNRAPDNGYVSSTDSFGNVYTTANVADTIIFGTYTLTTSSVNFVASYLVKLDPGGNVLWAKKSNGPINGLMLITSNYVVTDKNGNSYETGLFADTAIFDNDSLLYGGRNSNIFLVKYNTTGSVSWAKESKGSSNVSGGDALGEALDRNGNIYITGVIVDTVLLGNDTLIGPYENELNTFAFFLAKYDSNGNVKWARQSKAPTIKCFGEGYSVTCDNKGFVYATGEFTDAITFGGISLVASSSNYTNIFVVKYDSSGNVIWAIQSQTPASYGASAWSISSDTVGHIYVWGGVGSKMPEFIIDKDTLTTNDTAVVDEPAFLLKFDTAGHLLCGNIFPYSVAQNNIISDPTGNYVYYGATLATEAIFGKDTINPLETVNGTYPILARWEECDHSLSENNIATPNNTEVKVYPNPNNGSFTIALQNVNEPAQMEIYNVLGEKVFSQLIIDNSQLTIDLKQPNGVYFYRVIKEDGEMVGSGKVVIGK